MVVENRQAPISTVGLSSRRLTKGVGFFVGLSMAICVLALYRFEIEAEKRELENQVMRRLDERAVRLSSLMGQRLFLLRSLHAYVLYEEAVTEVGFDLFAETLLAGMEGVSLRLAPDGIVSHMVPASHAYYRLGEDLTEVPQVMDLIHSGSDDSIHVYPRVAEDGLIMEAFMPVLKFLPEEDRTSYWGLVSVSVKMTPVLSQISDEQADPVVLYCLKNGEGRVLWGVPDVLHQKRLSAFIDLPGRPWTLAAVPKTGWNVQGLLILIPLIGLPLSVLIGWLVVILQRQGRLIHERNLEHEQLVLAMEAIEERNLLHKENEKAWAALREKDALQRKVFESLPLGLILCDTDGRPVFVNEVFAAIIGRTVEETLQLTYWDLTPSDYMVRERLIAETLAVEGGYGPYEKECLHKDGHRVPVRMHGLQVTMNNQRFICTTVEDISQQRLSERLLRDSQQTSADIMEASPSGILVYQYEPPDELRLVAGNRQAETLSKISIEDCRGLLLREFWPDSVARGVYDEFLNVARTGRTLKTEQIHHADNGELERAYRLHVFRMPGNRVGVAFDDISEARRNELALVESEAKLQAILNNTTALVFIKDLDGRYIMANKSFLRCNGLEEESQVFGKTADEIFGTTVANHFRKNDSVVLERGEAVEFEEIVYDSEGRECIYLSIKFALKDSKGEIFALCGIATDITERKLSERALRESEERYRTLVETAPEAIVVFDPITGSFVDANTNAERLFGLSREALLRVGPSQISPRNQSDGSVSAEVAAHKIRDALMGKHPSFEWDHTNPEGDRIPCEVRLVRIPGGRDGLVRATITDISERRRQEIELRQLRQLLTGIIDAMPSMVVGITPQGKISLWSREAQRLSHVKATTALGRPLETVFPLLGREMDRVQRAIVEQAVQRHEKVCWELGDQKRYMDITIYPLSKTTAEGAVIRVDDVTDRLRMEEMMVQTEKMMSVGGLAAGMAHEINNPLAGILQNIQVLNNRLGQDLAKNRSIAEDMNLDLDRMNAYLEARGVHEMIRAIMASGKRAAAIVDNMLSFSRKGTYRLEPCDVVSLLEKTLELASNDYDLKKRYDFKSIQIQRQFPKDVPNVMCEAGKIQQVFFNLLKNGAQAMTQYQRAHDDYQPCFTLQISHDNHHVCIDIGDNGPGMDETVRKRVFEPFYTTKDVGEGTGLGLSVSYFIVTENHRGHMEVQSTPGEGARFIIHLPIGGTGDIRSDH